MHMFESGVGDTEQSLVQFVEDKNRHTHNFVYSFSCSRTSTSIIPTGLLSPDPVAKSRAFRVFFVREQRKQKWALIEGCPAQT